MTIIWPIATATVRASCRPSCKRHAPLDLVILLLGTNDMKPVVHGTAFGAVQGIERLVKLVWHHSLAGVQAEAPEILIVAPPAICETAQCELCGNVCRRRSSSRRCLHRFIADLADELGCGFFDAGSVAKTTPIDGVHLDAENTRAIGRGLEPMVRMMLGL